MPPEIFRVQPGVFTIVPKPGVAAALVIVPAEMVTVLLELFAMAT
jgi:hypothetical protein